jgi:signal transduction histidine kinase
VAVETADDAPAVSPAEALGFHEELQTSHESVVASGAYVVARLLGEGRMLGSLGVAVTAPADFTGEQRGLLATVGGQIGTALENARLYRQRQESLQSYARQVMEAQEEERLRIARELHDETAQELVQLVRKLEQLEAGARPSQVPSIDDLVSTTRETLRSVRRFARDLRPSVLDDLGLVAAIEMVVEETSGRLPAGAALHVNGVPRRMSAQVELALFRIVQEALRNAEKHAGASSSTVELTFDADRVRLEVSDDGDGFDVPRSNAELSRRGKLGLIGMRERAHLIGASFELESTLGRGARLVVEVAAPSAWPSPVPGSPPRAWGQA